jgi:sugar lactone lactonase YvrE
MKRVGGRSRRGLAGWLACCVTALVGVLTWVALAGASGAATGPGLSADSGSSSVSGGQGISLSSPVMPGVQTAGEIQQAAARAARRNTPAAIAARVASRTKFAHLGTARAALLAREAFPEAISHRVGGPPSLPAGQRILGYASTKAAQLELPGHKHALVESLQPMAIETSRGHREPVDLGLTKTGSGQGGVFESVRPLVGVLIGRQASEGVTLPEAGVSLTPVNAQGAPLGGSEGQVDGASVLYANTQTDTDTAVKPTTDGVEVSSILRSIDSPERLYFRVGLPPGASLVQSRRAHGPVKVISDGRAIAVVLPPSASDAEGTSVPVSMSTHGDLLELSVSASKGEYRWPVAVDPEVFTMTDTSLGPTECHKEKEPERISSNWCVFAGKAGEKGENVSKETGSSTFKHDWGAYNREHTLYIPYALTQWSEAPLNTGEYTVAVYHTQGESKIICVETESYGSVPGSVAKLELAEPVSSSNNEEGRVEHWHRIAEKTLTGWGGSSGERDTTVCAGEPECGVAGAAGNIAAFKLEAVEPFEKSGYRLEATLMNTWVDVAQENGPVVTFNEEPEIEVEKGVKRLNSLYGEHRAGGKEPWLSPYSNTAFEVKAHDPGIGVSSAWIKIGSWKLEEPIAADGKCNGIQCNENYQTAVTYSPGMAEGEPTIEWEATNKMWCCVKYPSKATQLVKVDAKPPSKLEVSGWPASHEISAAPHTLTVSATDEGPGGVHSSGVKSIAVSLDGGAETGLSGASCSLGPCTASGKYTLDAEGLSEGVHRLIVTAIDNAGNVSPGKEFTFDVRHGSPVPVGPGTVDSTTGQFKLSESDVSLASAGSVSRTYESRNLAAGAGGPLGPQWALSLGDGEGLTVLPNGSVVLSSSAGSSTTFTPVLNGEGKPTGQFESPLGDGNLKVEAKEETGKGITEYLLIDSKAGSTTTFKQPIGTELTAPLYSNQFGDEGAQMKEPGLAAIDSSGDLWVADWGNDRILKYSPAGVLLGAYGAEGAAEGQLQGPFGIAINQSTGNVYVADEGNHRIVELNSSGEFEKTMGWGVTDGKNEFEICKKGSYTCQAGIAGSGQGQLNWPKGIAVDSSGDVWVADAGNDRIQEYNAEGEYLQEFGKEGSGELQFKYPIGIAFAGGNLYVAERENNRVQEVSPAGKYLSQFGKEGTGNGEFKSPRGIVTDPVTGNLYVVDGGNDRVQELSTSGKMITKFGSAGSGAGQFSEPRGVVVSASGGIYVSDAGNNRVQEWSRSRWLPTLTEGSLKTTNAAYAYKPVEEEGATVIEPTEELAPAPAGVTCVGEEHGEVKVEPKYLTKGCRALTFEYPEKTTATGEKETQWGNYAGHLAKVYFHAWDPSKGAMSEPVVAQYAYDAKGRLRAEWDPRIETSTACGKTCTALKTTYGYDGEGHVTVITPPGQQPWAMTYGTLAGDPNAGRLLKVTQAHPKASESETEVKAKLKEQKEQTTYSVAPKLSGTAVVGVTMGVSSGTWSNSPVAYAYQWEDCTGKECTPILGATNPNYKVAESDVGHTLVARVTATNSAGSVLAETLPSSVVASSGTKTEGTHYSPEPGSTIEYRVPVSGSSAPYQLSSTETAKWAQKDNPTEAVAIFPPDESQGWPAADYKRATIDYMDEQGRTVNIASPTGGISTAEYNEVNEVTRTLSADDRAQALKESKPAEVAERLDTKTEYSPEDNQIVKVLGPEHKVKLASGAEVQARAVTHDYYSNGTKKEEEEKKAAEEKNKETYNLVTKTTEGALLSSGKEEDKRETVDSYSGQGDLGWKLRKPTSLTKEPSGLNLTTTTVYEEQENANKETESNGNIVETTSPMGNAANPPPSYESAFGKKGTGKEEFEHPDGNAVDSSGNIWVTDTGGHFVEKFSSAGTWLAAYGQVGEEALYEHATGIAINQSTGNVYIADDGDYNRIVELSSAGKKVRYIGESGTGAGQVSEPWGVGLDAKGDVWVADRKNQRIDEFNEEGKFINAVGWGVSNGESKLQVCTTTCKAGLSGSGEGQLAAPAYVAVSKGNIFVSDKTNGHVVEFNEKLEFVRNIGSSGSGPGQLSEPGGISLDSVGDVYVADSANDRVEEFSPSGTSIRSFGSAGSGTGQFAAPEGITLTSSGNIFVSDSENERVQEWATSSVAAHTDRTIYYSAEANVKHENCGKHPEWANLVCQTEPASQPADPPNLPVSTFTYNVWDEVEKTEEKFGSTVRKKIQTYDPAGRALTSEETSTIDTALPKVTNEYNAETGALEKQSATIGGKTKTVTGKDNTLGQLVEYADAEGNVAKYAYEEGSDGRLEEINEGKGKEAENKQTFSYNATTGLMEKLIDSAAGTFTASYDVEGKMIGEVYPNGMCANTLYNSVGATTSIEYLKPKTCTESKPTVWFSDSAVPSIHGETLKQTSTLAKEEYKYDEDGRTTETQETPAGKGCKSRLYAYDEESNRISETVRESSTETCATEGGTTQYHTYDTANRLTDSGVEYETFGNTTKLPPADAEHEMIDTYYVDNQLASQKQNEQLLKYTYDPAGRTMETVSENEKTKAKTTTITHYAGSGSALTWTSEGTEKWTRNIRGIDGALDAVQEAGKTPVLQLHDLQGNIVGTVGDSESETKLLTTYNSTEFGVPQPGTTPPKYSWAGAAGVSSEPSQGAGAAAQSGAAYVPQVARSLQTAPVVPPGAFPDGQGTGSQYDSEIPGWYVNLSSQESANTVAEYAAKQKALEEEEERIAANQRALEEQELEAAFAACKQNSIFCGIVYLITGKSNLEGGGPSEPLGGSDGFACEDAAETGQEVPGCGGGGGGGSAPGGGDAERFIICHNHEFNNDPSQGCCKEGKQVASDTPGSVRCDLPIGGPHPPSVGPAYPPKRYPPPYCPSGTEPNVTYFTGKIGCIPEGGL